MWRWHFFAGLFIAPFLILLAISGIIYLFTPQIEDRMYSQYYQVEVEGEKLLPSEQINAVSQHYENSSVTRFRPGESEDRSSEVRISLNGESLTIFVNPYNGNIIGEIPTNQKFSTLVKEFHGELMLGTLGDRLVELAACWTLVLIITGMYLWLPRSRNKLFGVVIPRLKSGKKIFIRDLHVVPGFWVAGGLTFLILTGLLWTGFWGTIAQNIATNIGLGYPPSIWVGNAPTTTIKTKDIADVPWNAQNLPVPSSNIEGYIPVSIDDIVELANDINIHPAYEVIYPSSPEGVYTLSVFPDKAEDEATIHIDQYTGAILADYRYEHYEPIGKLMAWGITVHKGREYGLVNQLALLFLSLGVIGVAASGVILWWKRKPKDHMGAPKLPKGITSKGFIALMIMMGIIFPLFGLSLVIILLIDWLVIKRINHLKKFFNR